MIVNPANYDLDVYKDRDFSKVIYIQDNEETAIDITDWTFAAQIRPTYSSETLVADFTITVSGTAGKITLTLDDSVTEVIDTSPVIVIGSTTTTTNMVWDLITLDNVGDRYSIVEGKCTIHETVTRGEE